MIGPRDVRRLALALPQAHEEPHFESTSFRVGGRIFATMDLAFEAGEVVLKLDPQDQFNLTSARPGTVAPADGYWGRKGWTRLQTRGLDAQEMATFLQMAWFSVAPKKLAAALADRLKDVG